MIKQLWVRGLATSSPKIVDTIDDSLTHHPMPEPIDGDTRRQRIALVGNPLRQLQSTAGIPRNTIIFSIAKKIWYRPLNLLAWQSDLASREERTIVDDRERGSTHATYIPTHLLSIRIRLGQL